LISRFVVKLRERIGNPFAVSTREIAEMVIRIVGGASEPVFEPLPEDDPERGCPGRCPDRR
jgi:hypothetical protein